MTTPDYQCPGCANGYLGFGPSKKWYAGDGCNPNLCHLLDKMAPADDKGPHSKILRHWKQGDFNCPAFGRANV